MRDTVQEPYTKSELRVVEFLNKHADVGGGDDPIGFILASYAYLTRERDALRKELDLTNQRKPKFKMKPGGPPCPTCGFVLYKRPKTPFQYRAEE